MKEKKYWFLRMGNDYLEQAKRYRTQKDAIEAYKETARELAQYGQAISATLHIAPSRDAVVEYPDYVLALSERGAVIKEQA
jgi:hypothetical protein